MITLSAFLQKHANAHTQIETNVLQRLYFQRKNLRSVLCAAQKYELKRSLFRSMVS